MRPLEETEQHDVELTEFDVLTLQHCGYKSSLKITNSKSQKSLEFQVRQISQPNIKTEDQFEELWKDVIVTFVKGDLILRYEQKKLRDNILNFSLLTIHTKLTHSQNQK